MNTMVAVLLMETVMMTMVDPWLLNNFINKSVLA
jgi:hypothetical protein